MKVGRWAALRAMREADVLPLAAMQEVERIATPWRGGMDSTPPSAVEASLWSGVDFQSVVASVAAQDVAAGLCVGYGLDWRNGCCFVAAAFCDRTAAGTPVRGEGVALFIESLFGEFGLRRVLIEATDEKLTQFKSVDRFGFKRSVTFPARGWSSERGCVPLHVFSLDRADWMNSPTHQLLERRGLVGRT